MMCFAGIRAGAVLMLALPVIVLFVLPARSAQVGTTFTYQGALYDNSVPANAAYDFRFSLFDAPNAGAQVGSTIVVDDLSVSNGIFTVELDFGSAAYYGDARWLRVEVRQGSSGGGYTDMGRQHLNGAPFAIGLSLPLHGIATTTGPTFTIEQRGTSDAGLFTTSINGSLTYGVQGQTGSTAGQAAGVRGVALGPSGNTIGVEGRSMSSPTGTGVVGAGTATGAYFSASNSTGTGVFAYGGGLGGRFEGTGTNGYGIEAHAHGTGVAVYAEHLNPGGSAIEAVNNGSGSTNPTLLLTNFQASQGMCLVANNSSTWGTAAFENTGAGEVMTLTRSTAGTFLQMLKGGDTKFWVDGNGMTHTRTIEILGGSDLSEKFDIGDGEPLESGTVVSIDADHEGRLEKSRAPYDHRVAGIISGAGGVSPGMLMGQTGSVADGQHPVALTGRVFCRVTTENGPIAPGDLLTTSSRPGCAMRATDPACSQGAIIGKAMGSLDRGDGLVLVLVGLQ